MDYGGRRINNIFMELFVNSLGDPTCEILDQSNRQTNKAGKSSGKLWMVGTIFRTGASAPSPCVAFQPSPLVILCQPTHQLALALTNVSPVDTLYQPRGSPPMSLHVAWYLRCQPRWWRSQRARPTAYTSCACRKPWLYGG